MDAEQDATRRDGPATDPEGKTVSADPVPTPDYAGAVRYSPLSGPNLGRGDVVGRYIILDLLGSGAMGAVYRAYDPELDRRIALKLLLPWTGSVQAVEEGRKRMQREAQAMAKLSHPNVIGVFDVGTFRDNVFFTMELITGQDLSAWFEGAGDLPRPWEKVVAVFVQAGEGLAAAHDAGVVHRDFKPGNVLLGEDGRVRVLDFGIARADEEDPDGPGAGQTALMRRADISATLTQAGTVVGTPAYMAPEQHRGADTDPRADQFAFCVALYEGLYGRRPFRGHDFKELGRAKRSGIIEPEPEHVDVPAWLRQLVRRGLAGGRELRYPDMRALLAELRRDRGQRRRRFVVAAAVVAAVGVGAVAANMAVQTDSVPICSGADQKVAQVWSSKVKTHIEREFLATGLDFAATSWRATRGALDRYLTGWTRAHVDACEDTRVRGEQSEELMDTRIYCLERHLRDVGALVEILGQPDADVVRNAMTMATNLPDLARCSDTEALVRRVKLPKDIQVRMQVFELRGRLSQAGKLREAGKYDTARDRIEAVQNAAREVGYGPLTAEILLEKGRLELQLGNSVGAEQTLYEAGWAAQAARHDEVEARAWTKLVYVVGFVRARYERGHWFGRLAEASLDGVGGMSETRAELDRHRGAVFLKEGRYDEALARHQAALSQREKLFGEQDIRVAQSANDVGEVLRLQGRLDEAQAHYQRAGQIEAALMDRGHPGRIRTFRNRGGLRLDRGQIDAAQKQFDAAYEIADNALGPDHPLRADLLTDLGRVAAHRGQWMDAETHYRNALALRERTLGRDHPDVGASLQRLGDTLTEAGRPQAALEIHGRGLRIRERVLGERHPEVAASLRGVGVAQLALGRASEAVGHLTRALEIVEERLGPQHPAAAQILLGLGRAHLAAGQRTEAASVLRRGVERLEAHPLAGPTQSARPSQLRVLATARFLLAQAMWSGPNTGPEAGARALALARAARGTFLEGGARAQVDEIDEWLAPRSPPSPPPSPPRAAAAPL